MNITSQITADQLKDMFVKYTNKESSIPDVIKNKLKKENITITARVDKDNLLESLDIIIEV